MFGEVDRTVSRVSMPHQAQGTGKGSPKLHGFWGSMRNCGLIYDSPGVIAQQTRVVISFILHRSRREGESILVSYQSVGQDCPEAVLNELGHFLS